MKSMFGEPKPVREWTPEEIEFSLAVQREFIERVRPDCERLIRLAIETGTPINIEDFVAELTPSSR